MVESVPMALFGALTLPLVAAGAAASAVALPILIHLLSRQRYQVVPWAAMRFLVAAQKRHRRKIDRWLLLLMRVLSLLLPLLGLCAATPWAEKAWQSITPGKMEAVSNLPRTHHILVLDGSLSMSATKDGSTRFERAVSMIETLVQISNPGDGFTLIDLSGSAQAIIPGPSNDPDKVLNELRLLKVTHGTADVALGLSLIADTLQRSPRNYPRRQVTIFTDNQRSAWANFLPKADVNPPEVWKRILSRCELAVVDCAGADVRNLSVVDVSLADPLALVDAPNAIMATIQNDGATDQAAVRVELALGKPIGGGAEPSLLTVREQMIEVVPAGKRLTLSFPLAEAYRFREMGLHLIRVRIADADSLAADDSRAISVNVKDSITAMVVNGNVSNNPEERASEYVQLSLQPGAVRLPTNPAECRTVSLAEFADPALSDLTKVDCVFLCDVPTLMPNQVARLEAHLKRGGGLVIGLGPNAEQNLEWYNRVLYNEGNGILPGKLLGLKSSQDPKGADYRLATSEDALRRDPLAAFGVANGAALLTDVPFTKYIQMDAPADGRARRVLSFVPLQVAGAASTPDAKNSEKPDPAVVEWPKERGRVIVYTSSFNKAWTEWPSLRSFLPFVQEVLRYAASSPERHTLRVGEVIEEYVPVVNVGMTATITTPEGQTNSTTVEVGDGTGLVQYSETMLSGLYRLRLGNLPTKVFAVNTPDGGESDLQRIEPTKFVDLGPGIQVVNDPNDLRFAEGDGASVILTPRPHGPTLARWFLTIGLVVLVFEVWLAWWVGPSRGIQAGVRQVETSTDGAKRDSLLRTVWTMTALIPLFFSVAALSTLWHYEQTGEFLGFLPEAWRAEVEASAGVPAAGPGEGTRWRLESFPAYFNSYSLDRRILAGVLVGAITLIFGFYWYERQAARGLWRVLLPALLRITAILLLGLLFLPQIRLAFDREGWPDVAILLDTSASMATEDDYQDPQVRQKAEQLGKTTDLPLLNRLQLAKQLLVKSDNDWLEELLTRRQVKVHLYAIDEQPRLLSTLAEPKDAPDGRDSLKDINANGPQSRLGDSIMSVLKSFRGGSLAAMIVLTDGITTQGEELPRAGREAARAGVPLFLVGLGESKEPQDLILSDLKADDVVVKGDQLVFEARLTAKGPLPALTVPVVLYERQGNQRIERARITVRPDAGGKPVTVRLTTIPTEIGEKSYVIEVPAQVEESELGNNRLERTVLVTESKKLRVLYVEGYPRYEYRFVKAQLERETEADRGNRAIELGVLLLDASPSFFKLDKSALEAFPTKTQLLEYDVVILGDLQPSQLERANQFFGDLNEFVKVRGGGLLLISGEHGMPHKLYDTPLSSLLPVVPTEAVNKSGGPAPTSESSPIREPYSLQLTALGRSHPLFRFAADEGENQRILSGLMPMYWSAEGYRRKPSAEVLAVHPTRSAAGTSSENHPIALQQFVGAGRVLFLGFDETWRWRFRQNEERFNQFWTQMTRTLARTRLTRITLETDKQTNYRQDDPIRLTVRYPDDAPAPADGTPVRVQMNRKPLRQPGVTEPQLGDTQTRTVQLVKIDGTRATYETLLTRTPVGEYEFLLNSPATTGNPPRAEARVLPPPGERDRLEMNQAELMQAASESRGQFYRLNQAEKLIDDLPDVTRLPLDQPCPPLQLWNHALAFALFALLLAFEWWLRRRERLV